MGKQGKKRCFGRPRKRIFRGNQHTHVRTEPVDRGEVQQTAHCRSASASKLRDLPPFERPSLLEDSSSADVDDSSDEYSDTDSPCSYSHADPCESDYPSTDEEKPSLSGYRLVDLENLAELISSFCSCQLCGGDVQLHERTRCGIAPELSLTCATCGFKTTRLMSQRHGRFLEVNRRAVFAARVAGIGREGLQKFFAIMNMPPPFALNTFHSHQNALLTAATAVAERSMCQAALNVREVQEGLGSTTPGDTSVTFDRTCMRRGHTSLHCVATAIAWPTGQMVDYKVYSKFCHSCSGKGAAVEAGKLTEAELYDWLKQHHCAITTTGSSGSMEVQGAVDLWQRSQEKRQLRYLTSIGDGDCMGHKAVVSSEPYDPDCPVEKEECVGHVQKRVGCHLRELKKVGSAKLSDGKPLGGAGRLPDRIIDLLQTYFGMAIRGNTSDLQAMAKACWAALLHKVDFPKPETCHRCCPAGNTSWCDWQRLKPEDRQEEYVPTDSLPLAVYDVVKPIWVQLTDKSLLQRCLCGATQNRNEAWNGMLWGMCPSPSLPAQKWSKSVLH